MRELDGVEEIRPWDPVVWVEPILPDELGGCGVEDVFAVEDAADTLLRASDLDLGVFVGVEEF